MYPQIEAGNPKRLNSKLPFARPKLGLNGLLFDWMLLQQDEVTNMLCVLQLLGPSRLQAIALHLQSKRCATQ